ncbi:MAG: helix-turn-helix domain-containing protein [bacterium]
MEGLGEFLRKGRERSGVTLEDLARRTRIRIENLESLEKEDLESLPSDAYVRGFVRQVCREIGVEANEAIVRYEMLRAQSGPPDEMTWAEERVDETPGRLERALEDPERVVRIARRGGWWAGAVLAGAAVLLVLGIGWRVIRGDMPREGSEPSGAQDARDSAAQAVETASPAAAATPEAPSSSAPTSVQTAQTAQTAQAAPSPAASPEKAPVSPEKAPAPPQKAPELAREKAPATAGEKPAETARETPASETVTPGRTTPPRPTPAGTGIPVQASASPTSSSWPSLPDPAGAPPQTGESGGKLVLQVVAVRAAEISVLLDGAGQPRRATLAAGERREWKADRFFDLTASDGGAVHLFLNGQDLGLAGKDGQGTVRTLSRTAH